MKNKVKKLLDSPNILNNRKKHTFEVRLKNVFKEKIKPTSFVFNKKTGEDDWTKKYEERNKTPLRSSRILFEINTDKIGICLQFLIQRRSDLLARI